MFSRPAAAQSNLKEVWVKLFPWLVCGLAAVFYCYEYLLRIIPSVIIPELMASFNVTSYFIGTISAFYYYAYTPVQIPVGLLMDKYGPRSVLTLAVLSCALGTLIFGQTNHIWVACFGRFLVGFGSAFAFVGVMKLATNWLPASKFALVSGLATTLGMFGAMYGKIQLAHMVDVVGWQQAIIQYAYVGLFLAPVVWITIRNKPDTSIATNSQVERQAMSYKALFAETASIFRNRQIWINGLIGCLFFLPTTVFAELWGDHFLSSVYGMDKTTAAKAVSMIFFGWAVGGPFVGWLSDAIGRRKPLLMVGSAVSALLLSAIIFRLLPSSAVWLYVALFFVGLFSSVEILCFAIGKENCAYQVAGTAIAITNFLIMMGGVIFQPVVGKALDFFWDHKVDSSGIPVYSELVYQQAMTILPVALLLAFVLGFFLKETYCRGFQEG